MLVPCGNPFGIKLMTDGVLVIGLQENCGKCAARESGIKKGDIIISIDGKNVLSNDDLSSIISRSGGKSCKVDLTRDGEENNAVAYLTRQDKRRIQGGYVGERFLRRHRYNDIL